MSAIGRNDICPCGSGFKFKRCCLNKAGAAARLYLPGERASALAKLMRFSDRGEFEDRHEAAFQMFWGDWLSEEPDEDLERVMDSEQVNLAYHSWFVFDFGFGEFPTMLEVFLEKEGRNLSSGERYYLEAGSRVCYREEHAAETRGTFCVCDFTTDLQCVWE
jgi:hypothetical protein